MTPYDLLAHCRLLGIALEPAGEALHYRAPKGVLTSDLKAALVERKAEIISILNRVAPSGPCSCNPLPNLNEMGAIAQAGVGPKYRQCETCGKTWQCKLCGGCRYCRTPG